MIIIRTYVKSPYLAFESVLRITGELNENHVQSILKQYKSIVSHIKTTWHYSIKVISETVNTMGKVPGTLQSKFIDIIVKTKLILKRIRKLFGAP